MTARDKLSLKVDNLSKKQLSSMQFAKDEGAMTELHSMQTTKNHSANRVNEIVGIVL